MTASLNIAIAVGYAAGLLFTGSRRGLTRIPVRFSYPTFPAPWSYTQEGGVIKDANGNAVAFLAARFAGEDDAIVARVSGMIVAAPDLLAALRDAEEFISDHVADIEEGQTPKSAEYLAAAIKYRDKCRAALAKVPDSTKGEPLEPS